MGTNCLCNKDGCVFFLNLLSISCQYALFIFFLDTGVHCHFIRVHMWIGVRHLVHVVQEEEGVIVITIGPTSIDACPPGVGDGDTTDERGFSGFRGTRA